MYETFYGLREKPFSLLPDPGFLYFSKQHRMALVLLEYGLMSQVSFSVVTGGIGTGKTTLIRQLLNQLDQDVEVGLISNTHSSFGELFQWVLLAFNLDYAGKDKIEMYKIFVDFLIAEYSQNKRVVLIIDEAQNLAPETLEELRMLSNINADKDQVLQIILVGQPGLRDTLRRPTLEQFAQRIAVDYHLEPLSQEETSAYIRHRVSVAGGNPELFQDDVCISVFRHSGGIPRLINLLCDLALVFGYAAQSEMITSDIIDDVAREKRKGGILPTPRINSETLPTQGEDEVTIADSGPQSVESVSNVEKLIHLPGRSVGARRNRPNSASRRKRKKLRIAIASNTEKQRVYLKKLLEECDMCIVASVPVTKQLLDQIDQNQADALLVDLDENFDPEQGSIDSVLDYLMEDCRLPVLFNDSSNNMAGSSEFPDEFGKKLTLKLTTLIKHGTPGSFLYLSGRKKAGAE